MRGPVRVLVVDDSAFARKVLREALHGTPRIEVVGAASDGLDALEKMAELEPDVVTLDLLMPELDGVGFLQALPPEQRSRVVLVSISEVDSDVAIRALELGAFDLVRKPTALATDRLYSISADLVAKVLAAAGEAAPAAPARPPPGRAPRPATAGAVRLVAVGTSTGGPAALSRLLPALPADLPVPVVVALHIPSGYTEALARRLDVLCGLSVREATGESLLLPGTVTLARGGEHLVIEQVGGVLAARVRSEPRDAPHRPSVDLLFESAARAVGGGVLGVVLTGMGEDGLSGARAIDAARGAVLTEAESSCIVYGMPRSVREHGLSSFEAPLDALPAEIVRRVRAGD